MKFAKIKLNRCKNCIYYTKMGNLHFCKNTKYFRTYKIESFEHISLVCFRKKKVNEFIQEIDKLIKEMRENGSHYWANRLEELKEGNKCTK